MASFEMAMALRGVGHLLLASEEVEPGHGFDYGALATIVGTPSTSAEELGRVFSDALWKQAVAADTSETVTMSLVDLRAIAAVAAAVDAFTRGIDITTLAPVIGAERQRTVELATAPRQPSNITGVLRPNATEREQRPMPIQSVATAGSHVEIHHAWVRSDARRGRAHHSWANDLP